MVNMYCVIVILLRRGGKDLRYAAVIHTSKTTAIHASKTTA